MRGEQLYLYATLPGTRGSPPLARGTDRKRFSVVNHRRITPACAGNSLATRLTISAGRDHPRLRGEQLIIISSVVNVAGSPPLARGTACSGSALRVCIGITPACAGNSWSAYHIFNDIRDHPRLRGEQPVRSLLGAQGGGSPPLARGTDSARDGEVIPRRITPACAGNSPHFLCLHFLDWDHPRLRGEQKKSY